ncbi:hypothetical protein B9Z55_007414 [Caenorhabditis nigoni]|uniref:Uncharacterized protein n=1 Tax=Caenorhabditis nigoni TaxID=1611254 RepID=A0A2G5V9N2_9PELO|nr:hypothetical protein B9Z55_007414 [Caenorhabditis nigoni]
MNPEHDHFGYQGPGPIDHMQHDPQNNLYYHNQFYPEAGRDQQRDHLNNYGQHQRNRYHQLHPHFQHLENGQQHHLGNQQQIHQDEQMNHHHRQQQNQFHQERQRFQEVQHHVVNLHRNQQQRHQVHDRNQQHHEHQQWHHHQQHLQPQQPNYRMDVHQSQQLLQNQNHDLRQNQNRDLRQNQQPDRQTQDQHHRMHMPQNNQMHPQRHNGRIPTHHPHTNRYNPILNDQNRRNRSTAVEQNRREQDLGAMNQRAHLQNGGPFDNSGIHFQGHQWEDPMLGQFNQEVPEASRQDGNPEVNLNGPAVAQMQQSPVPVPQDPNPNPQNLDPEIIRLREENRRLTDRVAALYDLNPISQEDLALLQRELGELRETKSRLEIKNSAQTQELEKLKDLSFKTGQENTAMKPRIVYLESRVKALEGELTRRQQPSSSAAPIPASGIKKEVVEDHPAETRPDHEVKLVAMVKSNTKTIKREVMEMPKTAEEAVERHKSMFEGRKIISEQFDIQCFLFNKTNPGEEKDGKWVPRKVLKACQLRNFYQHYRPKREYPEWKDVKKDAKAEERWRKRWMAVREEQMAQYHAGLIFFNDDYKNLKL